MIVLIAVVALDPVTAIDFVMDMKLYSVEGMEDFDDAAAAVRRAAAVA